MKKKSFLILLLVLIATLAFAGSGISVFASDSTALTAEQFRMYGVNARIDDSVNGLRFTAEVDETVAAEVTAENSGKTFGALMVPYDYLTDNSITVSDDTDYIKAFEEKGVTVLTKEGLSTGFREGYTTAGYKFVSCTISNIMYENLNRDFFGIIYIKTGEGDAATYEYASVEAESESYENVRSIYEISRAYYDDAKSAADVDGVEISEYLAPQQLSALTGFILKSEYANLNDGATKDAATAYAAAYTVEEHDQMVASIDTANALVQKGVSTFAGYSIKKALNDYNAIIDGKAVANPAVQTAIDALKAVETEYDKKYALLYETEDAFNTSTISVGGNDSTKTNGVDEEYGYFAQVNASADKTEVTITLAQERAQTDGYDVVYLPFYSASESADMRYNLNGNDTETNWVSNAEAGTHYIQGSIKQGWNYFTIPVSYLTKTVKYGISGHNATKGDYMFAMPVLATLNESKLSTDETKVYEIFDFNGLNNAITTPRIMPNSSRAYSDVLISGYNKDTTKYGTEICQMEESNENYGRVFRTGKLTAGTVDLYHYYEVNFDMIEAVCAQKGVTKFSFYVKYGASNDKIYCFGTGAAANLTWTKFTVDLEAKTVTCVDAATGNSVATATTVTAPYDSHAIYRSSANTDQSLYISNFFIEVPAA